MAFFSLFRLNETKSKNRNSTGLFPDPHNSQNEWLADVCVCTAYLCGGVRPWMSRCLSDLGRRESGAWNVWIMWFSRYIIYFKVNWRYRYLSTFHRAEYWIVNSHAAIPSPTFDFSPIWFDFFQHMIMLLRTTVAVCVFSAAWPCPNWPICKCTCHFRHTLTNLCRLSCALSACTVREVFHFPRIFISPLHFHSNFIAEYVNNSNNIVPFEPPFSGVGRRSVIHSSSEL